MTKIYDLTKSIDLFILLITFVPNKLININNKPLIVLRCGTFNNASDIFSTSNDEKYRNPRTESCKDPVSCAHWVYENPNSFVAEVRRN